MARRNTTRVSWSCGVCRRRRPWWGRNRIHPAPAPTVLGPHLLLSIGKGNTSKLTSIFIHNQRQTKTNKYIYIYTVCISYLVFILTFLLKVYMSVDCLHVYLFIFSSNHERIILSSILKTPLFCNLIFLMMSYVFYRKQFLLSFLLIK